ncbi:MAG: rod shape-determining protein MreC [Thermodesulfobacteriota bacterium]
MIDLPFSKSKSILIIFLIPIILYLTLYTWNWKTGHLDQLASYTGLEFVGWVLTPGKWLQHRAQEFWSRYVYLQDLQKENQRLQQSLAEMRLRLAELQSQAAEASRLRSLLQLSPPEGWNHEAARIIAHRTGPNSLLRTFLINKGSRQGVHQEMPVLTPDGVVGRVRKVSLNFSTVLLLTDLNSHIPVLSQETRNNAILQGQGPDKPLQVKYIGQNAPLFSKENLVTSGLAGIFPKGLPVAQVEQVSHSELSLFQQVLAKPLVQLQNLEEVLLLRQQGPVQEQEEDK